MAVDTRIGVRTILVGAAIIVGAGWLLWPKPAPSDGKTLGPESAPQAVDPAIAQFDVWTRFTAPAGVPVKYTPSTDYPTTPPATRTYPWESIEYDKQPEAYMKAVLSYCLEDAESVDFNFKGSKRWFHAPWLAREPVRGLTTERSSEPGELSKKQTSRFSNYAVGYYNEPGGYTFGQVWADKANPDPSKAAFPVGTVSCKLLFTTATPDQVDYIDGSPVWQIAPNGRATDARLLQFDIGVRDKRADSFTGWVFGTFMAISSPPGTKLGYADLVPVGLMWGNDPTVGPVRHAAGDKIVQGWMNPVVTKHFAAIRDTPPLSPELGLYGRVNGPVDNPKSSCLSCHGRALDGGPTWTSAERNRLMPFVARGFAIKDDQEVLKYFRNLKPNEPFLTGSQYVSLDYSLQLAVALENFHAWRIRNPAMKPAMADFENPAVNHPWIVDVQDAEKPKRGDDTSDG